MNAECIYRSDVLLGENPTWDWRIQRLYWVDIRNKLLCRLDPASGDSQTWLLPDVTGCFALTQDESRVLLAMRRGAFVLDLTRNRFDQVAPAPYDPERFQTNDGHCDRAGVFVVGSHDLQKKAPTDRTNSFYRFADGAFRPLVADVGVTNGIAFSPDNRTLYRSEFLDRVILAYDYDSAAGRVSSPRTFAQIPDGMGLPDGAAVDEEGGYWTALFDGGRVVRFDRDGKLDQEVRIGARQATMLAFGGPDLRTVYVTTANMSVPSFPDVGDDAGGIFSFRSDVPGIPEAFAAI